MPRNPLEGGVYHVYNRFARGEEVFADREAAQRFVEMIRQAKRRDGFVLYAWCLLSNHFHLALKTSAVPLARTMHAVQGRFARWFNQRHGRTGPLWQARYQARLVDDQRYFDELVIYIHLNPVRAGLVEDPGDYQLSGHGELLGRTKDPLVDAEETLSGFGDRVRASRRAYVRRLEAALESDRGSPTRLKLPWWRPDRELNPGEARPHVDIHGRSTGPERAHLDAKSFVDAACRALGTDPLVLCSQKRDRATTRLRELVAAVGIERWGQRAGQIARVVGKHPDVVSRWARMAARHRAEEPSFVPLLDALDRALAGTVLPSEGHAE